MRLEPGTRFGVYEIVGHLGAGGMGEVYRAADTTLEREVAIKVLPASLAEDADRNARFEQEAKTLAALNHPNIAHVYGLEKADGMQALVMELVEGATLADRIAQGPIAPAESLNIAMQIAEGLAAAHEKGIVHRDLKPANIKLTPDGTVKILDFGIAKAFEPFYATSGGQSPIMTTPVTQTGVILGTAAYMSPEQARGKLVDKRTDIWAFGCVLFEMLTGQPAFGGEDVTVTLARVLERDTDIDSLPAAISPSVRQTLRLCLQKDVRKRVRDIGDVMLALAGEFDVSDMGASAAGRQAVPAWKRSLPMAAALAAGGLVVGVATWALVPRPATAPLVRLSIDSGDADVVSPNPFDTGVAIAPGGSFVVYLASDKFEATDAPLYIRSLDELEPRLLAPRARSPFISPDGEWVGFAGTDGLLYRVASTGGPSVAIGGSASGPRGAAWGPDDSIVFATSAPGTGLARISIAGGVEEVLTRPNTERGELDHLFPSFLPDGRHLLFTITNTQGIENSQIAILDLDTHEYRVLIPGGSQARYSATGHIVYGVGGTLRAVPFDLERLEVTGTPSPVLDGVVAKQTGATAFDIANNGTLVYLPGGHEDDIKRTVVWVDRDGNEEPVDLPPRNYQYAQLSPDGTRIALDSRDEESDIWIWDIARTTLQRLTFDPGLNRGPVWFPDGQRVAFSREIEGSEEVYSRAADGSGLYEQLTEGSGDAANPMDITPDGKSVLYMLITRPRDLFIAPIGDPSGGTVLLGGAASEEAATVSPDGRWVAYQSDESGQVQVYVRPFPDVDTGLWQISTNGGTRPRWSRDGTELFYFIETGILMSVPVTTGETFVPGTPEEVFRGPYLAPNTGRMTYDVSLDGKKFLMIKALESELEERSGLVVVQNWSSELERLVPTD